MKRSTFAAITLSVLLSMIAIPAGCSPPGPVTTRDFNISDFTGVDVGSAFEVEIIPSDNFSVSVTANENLFSRIDVSKSGTTLKIGLTGIGGNFGPMTHKAKVTMPELRELKLSGASRGKALGFKSSQDFNLEVSGASTLDMDMATGKFAAEVSGASRANGNLKASDVTATASGASRITLAGSARNMRLEVSGASQAILANLPAVDADINLSGASRGSVNLSGKLDVEVSGGSTLEYSGSPTLGDVNVSGGASLKRK